MKTATTSHWLTTPHLVLVTSPLVDVLYCRCCMKPFGPITEAKRLLPEEWLWEWRELIRVRAEQTEGDR